MVQLSNKQKYEIIINYEKGYSIREISKNMKINRNTVMLWIKRYNNNHDILRKKGSGRKKKTNTEEDMKIIDELKENSCFSSRIIKLDLEKKGLLLSTRTIRRRLNEFNYKYKNPKRKIMLTKEEKLNRLKWAKKYDGFNWERVIFSDETIIWNIQYNRKRWIKKGENNIDMIPKYSFKKNIWGCINIYTGFNIFIFSGIMDSIKYINILQRNLLKNIKDHNQYFIFQDDNDPKHRAKITKKWKEENNIESLEWPPYNPDLNPIENVWNIIKEYLSKYIIFNENDFIFYIKQAYRKIDRKIIKNLINSMSNRIKQVIERKGDYVDY
jgi:transposase